MPAVVEPDEVTRKLDAVAKVGTVLDAKWHLDRLIAVGGWGAVYEATHRNGIRGAVKILDPSLGVSHEARQRFRREGRLTNRVQHPGVVRVLDDDEADDGRIYLVMELLEGETLEELASRSPGGRLEMRKAIEYGLQIAETLAAAHASGIVHRDIKPENLFLTKDGVVKLLDFGIAASDNDASPRLTRSGAPIGTPAFMAPEQARGRPELVDHQSDVYSLGASLYTLLTGKLVNEAETVPQMLLLTMYRRCPSLATLLPEAPQEVVRAIDRALEIQKSKRWHDAEAMHAALAIGLQRLVAAPAVVSKDVTPSPKLAAATKTTLAERHALRPHWLVGVALVVVLGIAFASIAAPRGSRATPARMPSVAASRAPIQAASVATTASLTTAKARRYDSIYDRRF